MIGYISYTLSNSVGKQLIYKIRVFEKMKELKRHIDQIKALCDSNKVKSLFAFGLVTTDQFRPELDRYRSERVYYQHRV